MEDSPTPSRSRHISRRKKLLFSLVVLTVFLVAAEVTCRLLTPTFWPVYTVASIRDTMTPFIRSTSDEASEDKSRRIPRQSIHPFFGYTATPGIGMAEKSYPVTPLRLIKQVGPDSQPWWIDLRANNWGFWSQHEMPYRKQPDDFVVVVLGGSVAQWLALQGGPTLAEQLKRRAPELESRNIVILNCALSGFKQPQQVMVLTYLLTHGVRPDVVVNVDGFNEAGLSYHNALSRVSPEYPRADLWPFMIGGLGHSNRALSLMAAQFGEKQRLSDYADKAVWWSKVSNLLAIHFMVQARCCEAKEQVLYSKFQEALAEDLPVYREFAVRGPSADIAEDRRPQEIVRIWLESSLTISSICEGRGIRYLHVLQPNLHDTSPRPAKPLSTEEQATAETHSGLWDAWAEGVRTIYPRFREQIPVLKDAGIAFQDLSYAFESTPQTIYYDICHYNQEGNVMIAGLIATHLAREFSR